MIEANECCLTDQFLSSRWGKEDKKQYPNKHYQVKQRLKRGKKVKNQCSLFSI